MASGNEHIDGILTNMVIGFEPKDLIVDQIFPVVSVDKESDIIPTWKKGDFFRLPDSDVRAPKTKGVTVEFGVGSDNYRAVNRSIAYERTFEEQANANKIFKSREKRSRGVTNLLWLGWELRVSNAVRSTSNVGSSTTLTGTSQWSDFANSDPINDVSVGRESIRSTTGLDANLVILSNAAYLKLTQHPDILERIKYVQKGIVTTDLLAQVFDIERVVLGKSIRNTAGIGLTDSFSDIWGKDVVLLHTTKGPDLDGKDPSYGYTMRWNNPELRSKPMAIERWNDPDNGKFENIRIMTYQDEKITAPELGYLIVDAVP